MEHTNFRVRKVAVLGAGVMGAQIAAHFVNAGVEAILFELPAREGDPNATVNKAIDALRKLEPSPIGVSERPAYIVPANYDQHLKWLRDCDLAIEAIAERLDWKQALYERVIPHLGENILFASNTSGLSINRLSRALPEALRRRFCGVHFFNPPRYMTLVELTACDVTAPEILDHLESFLTTTLGKGVIRAHDTPNFIANRAGVFAMLAAMYHRDQFGLGFDTVDALTGPLIGRPKSATFRTADVVGLDTLAHVINTMRDALADDPWHRYFAVPGWMQALIGKGALGAKTRAGIYRKVGGEIQVLDLNLQDYRPSAGAVDDETAGILKSGKPAEQLAQLRVASSPQARFLWACYRDVLHYSAVHLESIADNARDLDLALRWGFGWNRGPFETWQAAGWQKVAQALADDIAAGAAMSEAALPAWVTDTGRQGVHRPDGSWSPRASSYHGRSTLPVYQRQLFPDLVLGETPRAAQTVFENAAARLWHMGDDVVILSSKTRMHVIGVEVLDAVMRAIAEAERSYKGLVLWQAEPPFSLGANLGELTAAVQAGRWEAVDAAVSRFQQASQALRYAQVPTVAAVHGMALGGGCEFLMHCSRAVAAFESYIGLVEAGVGLVPAGGGCKELALRAFRDAKGGDPMPFVQKTFQTVAIASTSTSAPHALELGFLRPADCILMNPRELLYVAKIQARALYEAGYRAPLPPRNIRVAGKTGIATLEMMLVNMKAGGFISGHDFEVGKRIAQALCGGEVEAGSLVDEAWLLALERRAFIELLKTEKTQARIKHTLTTGQPLRN
jgi:3-hydroxyacyl-CoA dehydrogenase